MGKAYRAIAREACRVIEHVLIAKEQGIYIGYCKRCGYLTTNGTHMWVAPVQDRLDHIEED